MLSTDELAETVWEKFHEKIPDEDLSVIRFCRCKENSSAPGTYVFSQWGKYYVKYIDERGGLRNVLETEDFDDLFYHILGEKFFRMYFAPFTRRGPGVIRLPNVIYNCWLARFIRMKKREKEPDQRRDRFAKYSQWYGLFGDYYSQRWQKEMDVILERAPYRDNIAR